MHLTTTSWLLAHLLSFCTNAWTITTRLATVTNLFFSLDSVANQATICCSDDGWKVTWTSMQKRKQNPTFQYWPLWKHTEYNRLPLEHIWSFVLTQTIFPCLIYKGVTNKYSKHYYLQLFTWCLQRTVVFILLSLNIIFSDTVGIFKYKFSSCILSSKKVQVQHFFFSVSSANWEEFIMKKISTNNHKIDEVHCTLQLHYQISVRAK